MVAGIENLVNKTCRNPRFKIFQFYLASLRGQSCVQSDGSRSRADPETDGYSV